MKGDQLKAILATAWGTGGVAVVLLRGRGAADVLSRCFRPRSRLCEGVLPADKPILGDLLDGDGRVIDEVVVAASRDGRCVEVNCHGGVRVVQRVLTRLESLGARTVREPSDDAEANWPGVCGIEADVMRLVPLAATRFVVAWLSGQARGGLTASLHGVRDDLDGGDVSSAARTLRELADTWPAARRMIEPARIVLAGPPNSGKSTLANALSGREGSIVTDRPGTTRDWVEHRAAVEGVPMVVIDTAGVRSTGDVLETESIARADQQLAGADLVLIVLDASGDLARQIELAPGADEGPSLVVLNKCDLVATADGMATTMHGHRAEKVSALRGVGLDALGRSIRTRLGLDALAPDRPAIFTDSQAVTVNDALTAIVNGRVDGARKCVSRLLS